MLENYNQRGHLEVQWPMTEIDVLTMLIILRRHLSLSITNFKCF